MPISTSTLGCPMSVRGRKPRDPCPTKVNGVLHGLQQGLAAVFSAPSGGRAAEGRTSREQLLELRGSGMRFSQKVPSRGDWRVGDISSCWNPVNSLTSMTVPSCLQLLLLPRPGVGMTTVFSLVQRGSGAKSWQLLSRSGCFLPRSKGHAWPGTQAAPYLDSWQPPASV